MGETVGEKMIDNMFPIQGSKEERLNWFTELINERDKAICELNPEDSREYLNINKELVYKQFDNVRTYTGFYCIVFNLKNRYLSVRELHVRVIDGKVQSAYTTLCFSAEGGQIEYEIRPSGVPGELKILEIRYRFTGPNSIEYIQHNNPT